MEAIESDNHDETALTDESAIAQPTLSITLTLNVMLYFVINYKTLLITRKLLKTIH